MELFKSRIQANIEQSSVKSTELFRTKYWTLRFFHESFVFRPEKFRKFYRTLFCNRLYSGLLNSSIKFIYKGYLLTRVQLKNILFWSV